MSRFLPAFDILRGDGILTEDALKIIFSFVVAKLLDKHDIDFDNEDNYDYFDQDWKINNIVQYAKFSQLMKLDSSRIVDKFFDVWECVYCNHKLTCKLFYVSDIVKDYKRTMKHKNVIRLLNFVNNFDFKDGEDIVGDLYEHTMKIFKDKSKGKGMGQFFTPKGMKNLMINLVKPQYNESVFDPAMGTAGLLIDCLDYMKTTAPEGFVDFKIAGNEIHDKTFHFACANVYIRTNKVIDEMRNMDSISNIIEDKYDVVVANPPFGKGLDYESIDMRNKKEYLPFETNRFILQFLQIIMYILNDNGRCALVIPNGNEIAGVNGINVSIREYLFNNFRVEKIIEIEKSEFTNTGVSTVILYFVKDSEGTKQLTFTSWDGENEKEACVVSMEDLKRNKYVMSSKKYLEQDEQEYKNLTYVRLADVVEIGKGKRLTRKDIIKGPYPVIQGGAKPTGYHNEYNTEKNTILISSGGSAGYVSRYNIECWASDCFKIIPKENMNNDYLYYLLKSKENDLIALGTGACQKNIRREDLENFKIPYISLETQNKYVNLLQSLENNILHLQQQIEEHKEQMKYMIDESLSSSERIDIGDIFVKQTEENVNTKSIKLKSVQQNEINTEKVKNPLTNKLINVNGPAFKKLIKQGYRYENGELVK